ncbi:MAG TPA: peptidylprolyl isomerase [Gemmatimonadales bacterium]|nr:peptidylprolyl isomerase [Gemmatimonadales bacterium]
MRRLGALLLVLPLVACGSLHDAFSAHAADAATAAGQSLSAEQLGSWASQVKGMPLQTDNLQRLARVWIDYTLFANTVAAGRSLNDSALVLEAMWPLVSQAKWDHFRERLVAGHAALKGSQVDSAFNAGTLRAFQQIQLQVPPTSSPVIQDQAKQKLNGVLQQLQASHGGNFAALAKQYSQDASKANGGYMGVYTKGTLPPPFEVPAWKLAPGEMSGVVQTPYGFHIIRRPPLSEVRDSFTVGVQEGIEQTFDSIYIARLRTRRHLSVETGSFASVRAALQDADAAETNTTKLVTYTGGAFRVRDLVRWLRALDPSLSSTIPGATDTQLKVVLETLSTRDILLQQADSAHVTLTSDDWQTVKAAYDTTLAQLEETIQITPGLFHDSAGSADARSAIAVAHVNAYLSDVVSRRRGFHGVPPFLGATLRAAGNWSLNSAGIQRATEQAQAERAANPTNSAPPTGGGIPGQPPMRPAPGPAPVPGSTPARPPARGAR